MRNAEQVVEQEFLQVRAKILEIAAFYDRFNADCENASSPNAAEANISAANAERLKLLRAGCDLLLDADGDKAARVQLLFSRHYDEQWRKTMGV